MRGKRLLKFDLFLAWFCLIVVVIYIITHLGIIFFNSDTASVSLYVRETLKEHSYFPQNWYSGNEVLVFTPHTFMLPLTMLGLTAYSCRLVANVIIAILLVLSLYLLGKSFFSNNVMAVMVSMIAISNYSADFINFLDCQASYSIIILLCCVTLFFLWHAFDDNVHVKTKAFFVLFQLAVAFCSFNGIRYIVLISIPLITAIVLVQFIERSLSVKQTGMLILMGIIIPSVIGYTGYSLLSSRLGGWSAMNLSITPMNQIVDSIKMAAKSYLTLAGFSFGEANLGFHYVLMVLSSGTFILMTIVFPLLLIFYYKRMTPKEKLLYIFSAANFIITTASIVCTSIVGQTVVGRYYLVPAVFLWIQGCSLLRYLYVDGKRTVVAVIIFITVGVIMIHSLVIIADNNARKELDNKRYDEVTSCIEKENLSFGYASFWNSHIYTTWSDFDIEIAPIKMNKGSIHPFKMLTPKDYFRKNYHEGSTFLLLPKQEDAEALEEYDFLKTSKKKIDINDYYIYVFDYNISILFE